MCILFMYYYSHVMYGASVLYCVCVCSAAILDQVSTSLSRRTPYTCRYPLARTLDTLFTPCWPKFSHMHFSCCATHAHKGLPLASHRDGCPNPRLMLSQTLMTGWTITLKDLIPTIPHLPLVRDRLLNGGINNGLMKLLTTVHLSHLNCRVTQGSLVRSLHRLFLRQFHHCHHRHVHQ